MCYIRTERQMYADRFADVTQLLTHSVKLTTLSYQLKLRAVNYFSIITINIVPLLNYHQYI